MKNLMRLRPIPIPPQHTHTHTCTHTHTPHTHTHTHTHTHAHTHTHTVLSNDHDEALIARSQASRHTLKYHTRISTFLPLCKDF